MLVVLVPKIQHFAHELMKKDQKPRRSVSVFRHKFWSQPSFWLQRVWQIVNSSSGWSRQKEQTYWDPVKLQMELEVKMLHLDQKLKIDREIVALETFHDQLYLDPKEHQDLVA